MVDFVGGKSAARRRRRHPEGLGRHQVSASRCLPERSERWTRADAARVRGPASHPRITCATCQAHSSSDARARNLWRLRSICHSRDHRRRRRLRRLFLGRQLAARPACSRRAASTARPRSTICGVKASIRPWLFLGPALIILTVYLIYPVIETLRLSFHDKARRELRRLCQLCLGLRRPRVPQLDLQQSAVAGRRAGRLHLPRPGHRRAHRPDLVGQHRQEPDLPAARHLLRRRQRHLEIRLRLPRRGPDADRHPQRHRRRVSAAARRCGSRCPSGTTSS